MRISDLLRDLAGDPPEQDDPRDAFLLAAARFDTDPREQRRIAGIAGMLGVEETLYAQALEARERGEASTAICLLRECAVTGTGEAPMLLAELLDAEGETQEAVTWYQRAHDEGDPLAAEKLAEIFARPRPGSDDGRRAVSDGQFEWDLDVLLSAKASAFSESLRPLASTLDALRAAPVRGEMDGEVAELAKFRTFMLSVGAAGGDPRSGARPRHEGRPPRGSQWAKALICAAAAAIVIVGATVLTGIFSSLDGYPAQPGNSARATNATPNATAPGSKGLEGSATQEPARDSSPTASKQSGDGAAVKPSELCREYYAPEKPLSLSATYALSLQLNELAGGPGNVFSYCLQFLQPWDAGSTDRGTKTHAG